MAKNPIPAAYSRWGSFNILNERKRENLRLILEEAVRNTAAPRGSVEDRYEQLKGVSIKKHVPIAIIKRWLGFLRQSTLHPRRLPPPSGSSIEPCIIG